MDINGYSGVAGQPGTDGTGAPDPYSSATAGTAGGDGQAGGTETILLTAALLAAAGGRINQTGGSGGIGGRGGNAGDLTFGTFSYAPSIWVADRFIVIDDERYATHTTIYSAGTADGANAGKGGDGGASIISGSLNYSGSLNLSVRGGLGGSGGNGGIGSGGAFADYELTDFSVPWHTERYEHIYEGRGAPGGNSGGGGDAGAMGDAVISISGSVLGSVMLSAAGPNTWGVNGGYGAAAASRYFGASEGGDGGKGGNGSNGSNASVTLVGSQLALGATHSLSAAGGAGIDGGGGGAGGLGISRYLDLRWGAGESGYITPHLGKAGAGGNGGNGGNADVAFTSNQLIGSDSNESLSLSFSVTVGTGGLGGMGGRTYFDMRDRNYGIMDDSPPPIFEGPPGADGTNGSAGTGTLSVSGNTFDGKGGNDNFSFIFQLSARSTGTFGGNDIIGGEGTDTVLIDGNVDGHVLGVDDFSISSDGQGGYFLTGKLASLSGTNHLIGVERLVIGGVEVNLDVYDCPGQEGLTDRIELYQDALDEIQSKMDDAIRQAEAFHAEVAEWEEAIPLATFASRALVATNVVKSIAQTYLDIFSLLNPTLRLTKLIELGLAGHDIYELLDASQNESVIGSWYGLSDFIFGQLDDVPKLMGDFIEGVGPGVSVAADSYDIATDYLYRKNKIEQMKAKLEGLKAAENAARNEAAAFSGQMDTLREELSDLVDCDTWSEPSAMIAPKSVLAAESALANLMEVTDRIGLFQASELTDGVLSALAGGGFTRIIALLGGTDDRLAIDSSYYSLIDMGAGDDRVEIAEASERIRATMLVDGVLFISFADGRSSVILGAEHLVSIDGTFRFDLGPFGAWELQGGSGADALSGTGAGDYLYGNGGNDTLDGGEGADLLDGGTGKDLMRGGADDDRYIVDNELDQVLELVDEGIDTVESSVTFALSANIENLILTGTQAIDATGNGLANVLIGNSAANRLDGGAGADWMAGGAGDDTYIVDSLDDIVIEYDGEGFDTIETSISGYVLPANVERLVYTGTSGTTLTGDDGDNYLTGGPGPDILIAGGGTDTLSGGGGIDGFYLGGSLTPGDTIDGGASNDILGLQGDYANYTFSASNLIGIEILILLPGSLTTYSGGPGTARHSYHLTTIDANVAAGQMFVVNAANLLAEESLYFNGSAETDGSFFFFGGAGDDTLIGGAGADIFASGFGRDVLTGGGGADLFYFRFAAESPPEAKDSITDFAAGDHISLSAFAQTLGHALSFIDGAAFSGSAGQLRVAGSGTGWTVEIDMDGDGDADFAIDVTTSVSGYDWSASDFIL